MEKEIRILLAILGAFINCYVMFNTTSYPGFLLAVISQVFLTLGAIL